MLFIRILCNFVLICLNLQCTEYDFEHGTECLHLAQKYAKTSAALIDGPDSLWKVGVQDTTDQHKTSKLIESRFSQLLRGDVNSV